MRVLHWTTTGEMKMSGLLCGIGYNSRREHSNKIKAYEKWYNMFYRCYNKKLQEKYPTYIGCSVDYQWDDYQDFADWYTIHDIYDLRYELDKDLLVKNNKIYSPETCCLLPKALNLLILDTPASRGSYPRGVSFNKVSNKCVASLSLNGISKTLGMFDCPEEASAAYVQAKETHVKKMAKRWEQKIDTKAYAALMNWTVY